MEGRSAMTIQKTKCDLCGREHARTLNDDAALYIISLTGPSTRAGERVTRDFCNVSCLLAWLKKTGEFSGELTFRS